jgi:NAD(P)-dependent dehydrogenase (short-subunit alcohol dehydrogenase family)
MDIERKRIVVTGASSGIGRALLQELSGREVQIVAVGRDEARLRDAVTSASGAQASVMAFVGDVAVQRDVDSLFTYAIERMGGIDIFFTNAAIAYWERTREPDWDRIEAIFQTNVFSPIYAAEKMRALFAGTGYRVVITSSVLGRVGLDGYALYSSTKAALDRFAEVYRLESRERAQLVLVYPLAVRSAFYQSAGQAPVPWLSQPAEAAARAMLRGVEKDRKTIYTSWILRPMLLLNHLLPFTRRWYQAFDARASRRHWADRNHQGRMHQTGHER